MKEIIIQKPQAVSNVGEHMSDKKCSCSDPFGDNEELKPLDLGGTKRRILFMFRPVRGQKRVETS